MAETTQRGLRRGAHPCAVLFFVGGGGGRGLQEPDALYRAASRHIEPVGDAESASTAEESVVSINREPDLEECGPVAFHQRAGAGGGGRIGRRGFLGGYSESGSDR